MRVYAQIDLNQIISNFDKVKSLVSPKTGIMGIVKADAYGHGAVQVVNSLIRQGVNFFGVASLSEAEELRKNGIKQKILILSQPQKEGIKKIVDLDIIQTVYQYDFVERLSHAAGNKIIPVHIKVDTGMNRIGIDADGVIPLIKKIQNLKNIDIQGIYTHFACADDRENSLNAVQISIFNKVVAEVKKSGVSLKFVHAANSAATVNFKEAHYDMVRIGISLYENVMSLKSRIMFLKTVAVGAPVSYGSKFVAKKETTLATISAGYADGINRLLSNKGEVLIRGKRFPIVGTVCMDMFMVDVTGAEVALDDEVVIIGAQGSEVITAQEVADKIGTIDYEVMCSVSKRVPRIYN